MQMQIHIIPILKDNYAYLLRFDDGKTAIVDPGEAQPVIDFLGNHGIEKLDLIINTHHHGDHVAGNGALMERYGCIIAAPEKEAEKIGDVTIMLSENTPLDFGGARARIFETPGHTLGGVCLYFESAKALFSGDTLFSMGCGRLFEGTAEVMWESFQKIAALPDDTLIYPGHEYTLSNAQFCAYAESDNFDIIQRLHEARQLREKDQPTIPVTLGVEKKTNVFLRAGSADRFGELRKLKDNF